MKQLIEFSVTLADKLEAAILRLSDRERDVLRYLLNGLSAKEIGEALGISYRTVELHRTKIARKLGLASLPTIAAHVAVIEQVRSGRVKGNRTGILTHF